MDFENEARGLAASLDRGRGEEVARRLQDDAQQMGPQAYSALLKTVARYDQKGVGDDLVIVDNRNGTQEAIIQRQPIDVGRVYHDAPPQREYRREEYRQEPPRSPDCAIVGAGAGAIIGNVFAPNGRRGAGTAVGAIAGALIGNDKCNR